MQNNSNLPIKLFNYFDYSYKQNFAFSKKIDLDNTIIPEPLLIYTAITPHAINDWLLLFPGESLIVTCDVTDEFKIAGKYIVSVTFLRGPILLYPLVGEPYYTDQNKWTSNEVNVNITEAHEGS